MAIPAQLNSTEYTKSSLKNPREKQRNITQRNDSVVGIRNLREYIVDDRKTHYKIS
jgi:hypothetical protein